MFVWVCVPDCVCVPSWSRVLSVNVCLCVCWCWYDFLCAYCTVHVKGMIYVISTLLLGNSSEMKALFRSFWVSLYQQLADCGWRWNSRLNRWCLTSLSLKIFSWDYRDLLWIDRSFGTEQNSACMSSPSCAHSLPYVYILAYSILMWKNLQGFAV